MTTDDDEAIWRGLQDIAVFFLLLIVSVTVRGFVFSELWGWFVVPLGVTDLSVGHAIGLAMIVSYLTYQADARSEKFERQAFQELVGAAFVRVISSGMMFWGIGWIIHSMT